MIPSGRGCRPRSSTSLFAWATTASTTSWRMLCRERGLPAEVTNTGRRAPHGACRLVLGEDLPEQRQHVDLAHAGVGLVPADLEAPVGEVDIAPEHRAGRRSPAATEEEHGDGRAAAGRLDRMALGPGPAVAVGYVDDGFAAVELAGGLEQDRDLLGAVEVNGAGLRELQTPALADRRVAVDEAVVDRDGEDLGQEIDVHVDRAPGKGARAATVARPRRST